LKAKAVNVATGQAIKEFQVKNGEPKVLWEWCRDIEDLSIRYLKESSFVSRELLAFVWPDDVKVRRIRRIGFEQSILLKYNDFQGYLKISECGLEYEQRI